MEKYGFWKNQYFYLKANFFQPIQDGHYIPSNLNFSFLFLAKKYTCKMSCFTEFRTDIHKSYQKYLDIAAEIRTMDLCVGVPPLYPLSHQGLLRKFTTLSRYKIRYIVIDPELEVFV